MNQVAEGIEAEIPEVMIENQARQFIENFKMQIGQQGIPYEEYMKMTGMDEAKMMEDSKEPAEKQVRMDLATAALIKAENIEATDEDIEAEYKKLADQFSMDIETVKKYLTAEQIKEQILVSKAIAVVVDSAEIEVKPAPKKTAKKAAKKDEAETETETEAE